MSDSTASLKAQFDLHTRLYSNALSGISETESTQRENDYVNNIKFIAGHLLNTRVGFLTQLTGGQPDGSYADQFGRGVKLDPSANYPSLDQITSRWRETADGISQGLANLPAEALAAPAPVQTPIGDETMRGLFSFLLSHEAYHIGQLGLLRKMIGKEPMSYN